MSSQTETNNYRVRAPKLNVLRDCFEGGMDFWTALQCAGLYDQPTDVVELLRHFWRRLELRNEA